MDQQYIIELLIVILKVAVGLGMVIFVHELGHFIVAKLCGVRCDKFYLGFDIYGLKLCKVKYGETEYGIGILPLGGYVKMLGQEDNPQQFREEVERAKAKPANSTDENDGHTKTGTEAALFDPRSYLAKSVPQRMAIISAGVIMNLIFAFVLAAIAYSMGVKQIACGVGALIPGEAAWKANLQIGDQIVAINGEKVNKFRDLQANISLGDIDNGVNVTIKRPGITAEQTVKIVPDRTRLIPTIGISNPWTTTLSTKVAPTQPGSPAASAKPNFMPGDKIVQVGDVPIKNYQDFVKQLTLNKSKALGITVERKQKQNDKGSLQEKRILINVAPNPMKRIGLVMEMGPIIAVQDQSPAAKAGLKSGDILVKVNGRPPGDPMTLPNRLGQLERQKVTLTVEASGTGELKNIELTPRPVDWYEQPMTTGCPMTAPALGVTYNVLTKVQTVIQDSPAAKAGFKPGDIIVRSQTLPPDKESLDKQEAKQKPLSIEFGQNDDSNKMSWPAFFYAFQSGLPGTTVQLELANGQHMAPLLPEASNDWFNPERGFQFGQLEILQIANSFGEAIALGVDETVRSVGQVLSFLQKIGTQVSPRALAGPVSIAKVAGRMAYQSTAKLLLFLTLLSANLAVINILPIPILDGGHLVFLAYEGIRGKPADDRVQLILSYLGLFFILGLMAWVIGLDLHIIPRQ